jgi:DNA-binding NarL/FixJ family response regulator
MAVEQALPKLVSRPDSPASPGRGGSVLTPRTRARTRILIIDEKGIMRDGLCALLSASEEFEIVGAESSGAEALKNAASTAPQLVIIDFSQAMQNGPDLIATFKTRLPGTRVLVLTFRKEDHIIDASLRAGADGYILKNDTCGELFTALRSIAAGKGFISPSICDRVMTGYVRTRDSSRARGSGSGELTDRERQVMRMIAAGHRTREIADLLSLSHKTIEKHRTSLMRKLGLRNASAVAAYAISHGLGES